MDYPFNSAIRAEGETEMAPGEDMATTFTYFCVARGCDEQGWQAICLNLDIAAEGRTLADVKMQLNAAVENYITTVTAMPAADRRRLLNRSVPFTLKLKYALKLLWHFFRSKRRDGRLQASFEIPCHA
jgi:hypothetical protein